MYSVPCVARTELAVSLKEHIQFKVLSLSERENYKMSCLLLLLLTFLYCACLLHSKRQQLHVFKSIDKLLLLTSLVLCKKFFVSSTIIQV